MLSCLIAIINLNWENCPNFVFILSFLIKSVILTAPACYLKTERRIYAFRPEQIITKIISENQYTHPRVVLKERFERNSNVGCTSTNYS